MKKRSIVLMRTIVVLGFGAFMLGVMPLQAAPPPSDVWVDDGWNNQSDVNGFNAGLVWGVDAFNNVQTAIDAVADGGTVHVRPGSYYAPISSGYTYQIGKPLTIAGDVGDDERGPGDDAPRLFAGAFYTRVFSVESNDVTIEGVIVDHSISATKPAVRIGNSASGFRMTDSEIIGGKYGVALIPGSSGSIVTNNLIRGANDYGVWIGGSPQNRVENNEIYGNGDAGVAFGPGACDNACVYDVGGSVVSDNYIHDNEFGIYYKASDQEERVLIGSDEELEAGGNTIVRNCDGIYFDSPAANVAVRGNRIYDNWCITSGAHVTPDVVWGIVDIAKNWWGNIYGPYYEGYTEAAEGKESIENESGDAVVYFRPWCTDENCEGYSTAEVSPDELSSLFNTGTFRAQGGDFTETSSVDVNETVIIALPDGSSVTLPAGTTITSTGGGDFDATTINAEAVEVSGLSGLGSGVVARGALEWGADVGLSFSPAITVSVFVGEDLDGQTLAIKRSPDGGATWTSDGIVAPASCTVSSGLCTFQATKASIYASTSGGSSSRGRSSGGSMLSREWLDRLFGSPTPTPVPSPAVTLAAPDVPLYVCVPSMYRGMRGEAIRGLQTVLKRLGFFPADIDPTGFFGPVTQSAVKAFQTSRGISPIGIVGPLTCAALNGR